MRAGAQIIDGALDVFATKGFENATNKDIARASEIGSPALIYHYFQGKADLFREVIEQLREVFPQPDAKRSARAGWSIRRLRFSCKARLYSRKTLNQLDNFCCDR